MSAESAVFLASGGALDAETAVNLTRQGPRVTILEMLDRIGQDMGPTTRSSVRYHLRLHDVAVLTKATARRITDKGVIYEHDGKEALAEADTVVIAVGSKPETGLHTTRCMERWRKSIASATASRPGPPARLSRGQP